MEVSRKRYRDKSILLPVIIIVFICSFFMPLVVITLLQDVLYFSKSHWYFAAPISSYISFFIGMILITISLTIYFITSDFQKKWTRWVPPLFILGSFLLFFLSVTNYYYMDEDGIHMNRLAFLSESTYHWEDITQAEEIYHMAQGKATLSKYKFTMNNNETIEIPYRLDIRKIRDHIHEKLVQYNVRVTSNKDQLPVR